MAFLLDSVVPWGRNIDEYKEIKPAAQCEWMPTTAVCMYVEILFTLSISYHVKSFQGYIIFRDVPKNFIVPPFPLDKQRFLPDNRSVGNVL